MHNAFAHSWPADNDRRPSSRQRPPPCPEVSTRGWRVLVLLQLQHIYSDMPFCMRSFALFTFADAPAGRRLMENAGRGYEVQRCSRAAARGCAHPRCGEAGLEKTAANDSKSRVGGVESQAEKGPDRVSRTTGVFIFACYSDRPFLFYRFCRNIRRCFFTQMKKRQGTNCQSNFLSSCFPVLLMGMEVVRNRYKRMPPPSL